MKKLALLFAMVLGTINMNAQDYDLQGLAKVVNRYDYMGKFHEGVAVVRKNDKYGIIDKYGREIVACNLNYYIVGDFHEGLAWAKHNDKYGYIDKSGREIIRCQYTYADDFENGYAKVTKERNGLINKSGKEVIPCDYDGIFYASDNYVAVKRSYHWGFKTVSNTSAVPLNFGSVSRFVNGLSAVMSLDNLRYGYIDVTGATVIPFVYQSANVFSEGLALVKKEGKYGFIDTKGGVRIPFMYDDAKIFSQGKAAVCINKKWGYVDKSGNVVIPLSYSYASEFKDGIAKVCKGGKYGFINRNGEEIIPCIFEYDDVEEEISEGLIAIKKGGKYGYYDASGKNIIPHIYDWASLFSEGLAFVGKDGEKGIIDKLGNSTFNLPTTANTPQNTEQETFDVIETLPSFKGGQEALNRWISENMQYPQDAYNDGIQGRVKVSVEINNVGSFGDVSIVKSVHPSLDKEAIRLFKSMPKWNPGTQNGNPVSAKMVFPLNFKLE